MKTDDVMKALGSLRYGGHSCVRCKFRKISGDERCGVVGCKIALAAIDLLREKDEEIESLKEQNTALSAGFDTVKAYTVREMSERLKEKLDHYPQRCGDCFKENVDRIAKEMVEEVRKG